MNIGFTKMNNKEKDFILVDNFNGRINLSKEQISFLCDRKNGIGADGLILVETMENADCSLNYFNASGIKEEKDINGIECVALFLKDYYLKSKDVFNILTDIGIKEVKYKNDNSFSYLKDEEMCSVEAKNIYSGIVEVL